MDLRAHLQAQVVILLGKELPVFIGDSMALGADLNCV
jgi:hypothetical protein